jgi:hypothetical protein
MTEKVMTSTKEDGDQLNGFKTIFLYFCMEKN